MIDKSVLVGAMVFALAACGSGIPVPRTDAEKLKMASDIATLSTDPKMLDGILDSMSAVIMPTMRNSCETMPEDKRDGCQARLEKARPAIEASAKEAMAEVKKIMPELMQEMGAIMARRYTGEELAKMFEYQSSPEAASIRQKQPDVMAEYTPLAIKRMQQTQMDIMKKVQARVTAAIAEDPQPPAEPPV